MGANNLLYDRPDLDQHVGELKLYITGGLPNGTPGLAYEGRLQFFNAVGACQAQQIAGDTLPEGSQIYVDQATKEIVVAWPALDLASESILNPGFEDGTLEGWTITRRGEAGTSGVASASSSRPHSGSYSALWTGASGTGHAGGIEAVWENDARGKCFPLQPVTASAWIALDDTGVSQNRGEVRLHFYDADDNLLRVSPGTLIRGNDSSYRQSTVTASAPQGAAKVAVSVWTTANYSGGVRFGDVSWDLPTSVGQDVDAVYDLTILLRDSAGRQALWSGQIVVTLIVGEEPTSLTGLTFWYDGDQSTHWTSGTGTVVPADDDGDIVWRADGIATSPLRCMATETFSNLPTVRKVPVIGTASGFEMGSVGGNDFQDIYLKPAGATDPVTLQTVSDLVGANDKVIMCAMSVSDALAYQGGGSDSQTIADVGNRCGLYFYKDGTKLGFNALHWSSSDYVEVLGSATPLTQPVVATLWHHGGVMYLRINGVTVNSEASGTSPSMPTGARVGRMSFNKFLRVAQMCTANGVNDEATLLEVERFFGWKIGVTI